MYVYNRCARSEDNIVTAVTSIGQIRKMSQQVNIKRSNLREILKKDRHLKAYMIQLTQELNKTKRACCMSYVC